MRKRLRVILRTGCLIAGLIAMTGLIAIGQEQPGSGHTSGHTFGVQGDHFAMDGKPYQIISGEMHYARVPRAYWRDRLRKAKAMGLNTITTYVFWNVHEPRPGVFDFSGQNDIAEYIREAQAEGLNVILRPGPYVCARVGVGRISVVAAEGPQPGAPLHRSEVHCRGNRVVRSAWIRRSSRCC